MLIPPGRSPQAEFSIKHFELRVRMERSDGRMFELRDEDGGYFDTDASTSSNIKGRWLC